MIYNLLTEDNQLKSIRQNYRFITFIKNPSKRVQIERLKSIIKKLFKKVSFIKSWLKKYFKIFSELVAVNLDDHYEKALLVAVKQNRYAIIHIKNPSEKVQLAAIKHGGHFIVYIKNPSEKVQLAAVNQSGYNIIHIKNPSEKVQLAAIKQQPHALKYIENLSKVALKEASKNYWTVVLISEEKIIIGCTARSLKEWLKFSAHQLRTLHSLSNFELKLIPYLRKYILSCFKEVKNEKL